MIPDSEHDLEAYRKLRQGAWASLDGNVDMMRNDLSGSSIWGRIKRRIGREGSVIAQEAGDVARNNKAAVALGGLALVGWLMRKQIAATIKPLLDQSIQNHKD